MTDGGKVALGSSARPPGAKRFRASTRESIRTKEGGGGNGDRVVGTRLVWEEG